MNALSLAGEPAAPADSSQYLTFLLGGEMFAIGILSIKEIIEYHDLTVVPMMPPSIRGVINLRGAVVPVIDLQARFGRPAAPVTKRTCIVIVEVDEPEGGAQVAGVVVDAVSEVLEIAAADIEPPPLFGAGVRTDFIAGVGKVRGRFVILLAVGRILALEALPDGATLVEAASLPGGGHQAQSLLPRGAPAAG
ncbi:chemotaxis protein CheW [Achromobacter aloeverae]|uniref:Chemotaxis protein CheW n=1 Tax=Achromobacter aloeverae TaxID=1750518 RepID=A0A4Q1HF65_9BURK|nr:chemotaxis protein CheW [Achromobacter aloeverae]RXN84447.1 chemotaxis protein CheW [Achromobacter aloeverae]